MFKKAEKQGPRYYIKYVDDDCFWEEASLEIEGSNYSLRDKRGVHFKKKCKSLEEYGTFLKTKAPDVIIE